MTCKHKEQAFCVETNLEKYKKTMKLFLVHPKNSCFSHNVTRTCCHLDVHGQTYVEEEYEAEIFCSFELPF